MNTTQLGKLGEQAAAEFYRKRDFKIIVRNFRNRRGKIFGEIDFVAVKGRQLHFVEIKSRNPKGVSFALEALTVAKQARIIKAAQYFLMTLPYFAKFSIHFDLAVVQLAKFDKLPQRIKIYSDVIDDIDIIN